MEKHHKLALRLNPESADVHDGYAASFLAPRGGIEEALAESAVARQLNPFSPHIQRNSIFILMMGRRLRDVERESARVLLGRPDDEFARLMLALVLQGQRRRTEVLAEHERLFKEDPTIQHEGYVACLKAACGDPRPAEKLVRRLHTPARPALVPAMTVAWLHLHLGEIEYALDALDQACLNREYDVLLAKVGFGFDGIRDHPRFRDLLGRLGLD